MKTLCLWLCMISSLLQYQNGVSLHNHNTSLCRQDQKQLLLQLSRNLQKSDDYYDECDLTMNYYKTKYWKESRDCCDWDGVTCDKSTGFVIGLDLSCGGLGGKIESNNSLFHLTHLQNLNLAFNHFNGSKISSKFGWLNTLTHLNLSNSEFGSQIPLELNYLSNLILLDISSNKIDCDLKLLFKNMTKIEVLVLSETNISSEIPTNMSSFLTHLDLRSTGVHGNLGNNFFERPNLQVLRLSGNRGIRGSLPNTLNRSNVHSFKELDLSETSVSGRLPESIGLLNNLVNLDVSNCSLWGPIPESIGNMTKMEVIYLSWNKLSGEVPSTISNLQNLQFLMLRNNSFVGQIPTSLLNMSQLVGLDISLNELTGFSPSRAGNPLQNPLFLDLSNNFLREFQLWPHLQNLLLLDLSYNEIEGTLPSSICNMTYLSDLDLSNNKFKGTLPGCIGTNSLGYLTLSNNKFRGKLPGNYSSTLFGLYLRSNEFSGTIPTTIDNEPFLIILDLSDNRMEGPLPQSLGNCTQLVILNLGKNMIHDTFPWWLQSLPRLRVLILKSNNFHGSITPPVSNHSFSMLRMIDLSHNNFTGLLPDNLFATLQDMKKAATAEVFFYFAAFPVTLSVKGDDREFTSFRQPIFTTIDLSSNNFYGSIPESLAELTTLWLLNLSHNTITGSIPPALGHLTKLEQLDLSSNQLTGRIPHTLTNLTFLGFLNLSYNHLVGQIPESTQFSTFPRESYVGNLGLYGPPLTKSYGNGKGPPSPIVIQDEEDDDSSLMMGFTWQAVAMGYGCGIMIGFIIGSVMLCIGKPQCFARFYYREATNCLKRRKKRGRILRGRR